MKGMIPPTHPTPHCHFYRHVILQLKHLQTQSRNERCRRGSEFPRRLCDPLPQYDFIMSAVTLLYYYSTSSAIRRLLHRNSCFLCVSYTLNKRRPICVDFLRNAGMYMKKKKRNLTRTSNEHAIKDDI